MRGIASSIVRGMCAASLASILWSSSARAANVFLFPVFISDPAEFTGQNFFTAQAFDASIPLNVGNTTSPTPAPAADRFTILSQHGSVQALPGGRGGSMNDYSISLAGFQFDTNQVVVTTPDGEGSASDSGMLTLGTSGAAVPYAILNSFVYQTTNTDADHPDRWESFVRLTDLTTTQVLYEETDSADTINTFGNATGSIPASHVVRLEFRSHTDSNQIDGTAFGNGVLQLALGAAALPEPGCLGLLAFCGLFLRCHRHSRQRD